MSGETVYLGHDGIFRVQLQENGAGASLASVTKMTLSVGGVVKLTSPGPVLFRQERLGSTWGVRV